MQFSQGTARRNIGPKEITRHKAKRRSQIGAVARQLGVRVGEISPHKASGSSLITPSMGLAASAAAECRSS